MSCLDQSTQPFPHEDSIIFFQRHQICDRRQGHQIQHRTQVKQLPPASRLQVGVTQLKNQTRRAEMVMRGA